MGFLLDFVEGAAGGMAEMSKLEAAQQMYLERQKKLWIAQQEWKRDNPTWETSRIITDQATGNTLAVQTAGSKIRTVPVTGAGGETVKGRVYKDTSKAAIGSTQIKQLPDGRLVAVRIGPEGAEAEINIEELINSAATGTNSQQAQRLGLLYSDYQKGNFKALKGHLSEIIGIPSEEIDLTNREINEVMSPFFVGGLEAMFSSDEVDMGKLNQSVIDKYNAMTEPASTVATEAEATASTGTRRPVDTEVAQAHRSNPYQSYNLNPDNKKYPNAPTITQDMQTGEDASKKIGKIILGNKDGKSLTGYGIHPKTKNRILGHPAYLEDPSNGKISLRIFKFINGKGWVHFPPAE